MTATLPDHTTSRTGHRYQRFASLSVACAVIAGAVNLGLYGVGQAVDAALRVDPGAGAANHLIVPVDVAWKSVLPLAVGAVVLALVSRISGQWTIAVTVAGAALAAVSVPLVFANAHDTATGLLLAGMHTVVGLAYVVIGAAARGLARG